MATPDLHFPGTSLDEKSDIDQIVARFAYWWQQGDPPSIHDFLSVRDELRSVLLAELVLVDLRFRLTAGEVICVEDYLERYPELAEDPKQLASLALAEYEQRRSSDGSATLEEYLARFPQCAAFLSGGGEDQGSSQELRATHLVEGLPLVPTPAAGPDTSSLAPNGRFKLAKKRSAPLPTIAGYEILGELGRGGMGVVYKARQTALKRIVALKMVLSGGHAGARELARFRAEGESVARLQHPNIVQIFEVGEHDEHPYFSLEFIDGGCLAGKLNGTPQPARQAAQLTETVARAVQFAHERGIIHRDLKPANVLLMQDGTPKITDFGLAKQVDSTEGHTCTGAVMGTPSYMSPEQAHGQSKDIGPAADTYALGVILYELLTGHPPFRGETAMDTLLQVANDEPVPPSRLQRKVPRDLETICLKCLEKEPQRRYLSAEALAEDLRRFLANEPIRARPVTTLERGVKWVKRRKAPAALVAVGILLVLGFAAAGVYRVESQRSRRELARADARELVLRAEEAVKSDARQNWEEARHLLTTAEEKVRDDAALADLKAQVNDRLDAVQRRLAAHDRYQQFVQLKDQALFHGKFAAGEGPGDNLQATRDRAREALEVAGLSLTAAEPWTPDATFTEQESQELRRGCYELLLVLADAVAQPLPRQSTAEQQQQTRQALEILNRAPHTGMRTQSFHLRRARYLSLLGDERGAAQEQERAAASPPTTAADYYLLGDERYRQDDLRGALTDFERALYRQPDHFWARYYQALCYLRLKEHSLARDNLTACLAQRPGMVWIYLMRGFTQGQLQEFAAAEADFQEALTLLKARPDDSAAYILHNNRAVLHLTQGKFADAVRDLEAAIALRPRQYHAYVTLAQVYAQQKDLGQAIRQIGKAIDAADALLKARELDPSTLALLFYNRAQFHLERQDAAAAMADLDRVLPLEPADSVLRAEAQSGRGHLLQRSHRYEDALAAYDDVVRVSPAQPDHQRQRGEVLLRLARHREAIEAFDQYLKHGGKGTVPVYRARALAKSKLGEYQGAIADLTLALEREPKNVSALTARGNTYLNSGANQLALRDFQAALEHDPKNALAHTGRGFARAKLGNYRDGVADAEKALGLDQRSASVRYGAARVYAQAVGHLDSAPIRQDRQALELRAQFQDRALDLIREAVQLLPNDQRPSFWRDSLHRDSALSPIRRSPGFAQFEKLCRVSREEYGPGSNLSVPTPPNP